MTLGPAKTLEKARDFPQGRTGGQHYRFQYYSTIGFKLPSILRICRAWRFMM